MRNTMFQIFGKSESMTALNRLFLIGLSLEVNKEYNVETLAARASLDEDVIKSGCDCLTYAGLFQYCGNDSYKVLEL